MKETDVIKALLKVAGPKGLAWPELLDAVGADYSDQNWHQAWAILFAHDTIRFTGAIHSIDVENSYPWGYAALTEYVPLKRESDPSGPGWWLVPPALGGTLPPAVSA